MGANRLRYIILGVILSIVGIYDIAFAAENTPFVAFSDMTDGPVSGWEGSLIKGAAVTIWGSNFGATRGSSFVTCGGVELKSDADYAEWGATTNPTTARGLQRITFFLKSTMATSGTAPNTTIKVTTSNGTSNSISFHCRTLGTNHIYYVKTTGSDSSDGTSVTTAWASFVKVRQTVVAGDVVYFKGGTWTALDPQSPYKAILALRRYGSSENHANGTAYRSITLASYPGEIAQVGDGTNSPTDSFVERCGGSGVGSTLAYWTFSKFKILTYMRAFRWNFENNMQVDDNLRIIGCDIRTTYAAIGTGIAINPYTSAQKMYILGNYLHHTGKANDTDAHGYGVMPIYHGGGGQSDYVFVGWNEFYKNNGTSAQFYGHFSTDSIDHLHFYNNFVHDNGESTIVLGGGDGGSYTFVKNAWVYNNIFSNNCGGFRLQGYQGTGNGGNYYIYNNTFYKNCVSTATRELHMINVASLLFKNNVVYAGAGSSGGYYTDFNGNSTYIVGEHNCWIGQGTGPSWDSNSISNVDPKFVVGSPVSYSDFKLADMTSPLFDAGISISNMNDFRGITRPKGTALDIGAYELVTDTDAVDAVDFVAPSCPTGVSVQILQ